MEAIKEIPINIWDDFDEDEGYTYAYVENVDISHEMRKSCLGFLYDYIKENECDKKYDFDIDLNFHETENDYDKASVERCKKEYGEYFFFKRWEIQFKNISYEKLENLVEDLKDIDLKIVLENIKIPFRIYSES